MTINGKWSLTWVGLTWRNANPVCPAQGPAVTIMAVRKPEAQNGGVRERSRGRGEAAGEGQVAVQPAGQHVQVGW
jgi:hypothetical protein